MVKHLNYLQSPLFSSDFLEKKEEAFTAIYETLYEPLYALSHQIIGIDGEAEDVVVETIAKLFKEPEKFVEYSKSKNLGFKIENFRWYLAVAVRHATINRAILNGRRTEGEMVYHRMIETDIGLENALLEKEVMQQMLRLAMEELPDKCKEVIKLTYFNGLKYKEVAQRLNISINTVKTYLTRGKEQLRIMLLNKPSQTVWTIISIASLLEFCLKK